MPLELLATSVFRLLPSVCPASLIFYVWLQHYGLPTDGSMDAIDSDADGHDTWLEWKA